MKLDWMFAILVFVFGSMAGFGLVGLTDKRKLNLFLAITGLVGLFATACLP